MTALDQEELKICASLATRIHANDVRPQDLVSIGYWFDRLVSDAQARSEMCSHVRESGELAQLAHSKTHHDPLSPRT